MVRVIQRQVHRLHAVCAFDFEGFMFHPHGTPLTFVAILQVVGRVDFFDVNIGDVQLVISARPGDLLIEAIEKERAAEPTDAARVQLARGDQMSLIQLKPIRPRHVDVLDVDNAPVGGFSGLDSPLIRTQVGNGFGGDSPQLGQRVVNAVEPEILAPL